MVRMIAVAVIGIAMGLAAPSLADDAAPLRLADVLDAARRQNPEIQAARDRAQASSFKPPQASAYDDPMFAYEAWNAPQSVNVTRADNNILSISQKLPFPGKKKLAGEIAEKEAEAEGRDAARVELEVVAMAKRAYYDLWQSHQELAIYSRDRELVGQFARSASDRYAVGAVSQADALRAQVELTRLVNRVATAALGVQTVRAALAEILSRTSEEVPGIPESPPEPSLEEKPDRLIELAFAERPEIAGRAATVRAAEDAVRLARLNYLPDFEVRGSRFINYQSRDGWGAMASISIPLVYQSKYDAALSEANACVSAARVEQRRVQDQVRRGVTQAFLAARTALLQRDLFLSTHIPQAEQSLAAAEIAYQTGKMDFLSLIDSFRAIESIHLEHVRAEADFERAYADLERAVGRELPRSKP